MKTTIRYFQFFLPIYILLFSSTACLPIASPTPRPTFVSFFDQTPTAVVSFTPTSQPAMTATVLPSMTADPGLSLIYAGNHYASTSLALLGGYQNGNWLHPEQAAALVDHSQTVRIFTLGSAGNPVNILDIHEPARSSGHCSPITYDLSTTGELPVHAVGLTGDWPAWPREVELLSPETDFYQHELRSYLIARGINTPVVQINRILRMDLDNDGTDEVLVEAARFIETSGHDVTAGDYTLILMRKIVGGEVVTQQLVGDIYPQEATNTFPATYSIQGVLDVNGNGQMEILIYQQRWEGNGTILMQITDDQAEEMLRLECML